MRILVQSAIIPAGGAIAAHPDRLSTPLAQALINVCVKDSLPTYLG